MAAVTICSDFGAPKNKVWHCFHCFPIYLQKSKKYKGEHKMFWVMRTIFYVLAWEVPMKLTFSKDNKESLWSLCNLQVTVIQIICDLKLFLKNFRTAFNISLRLQFMQLQKNYAHVINSYLPKRINIQLTLTYFKLVITW